MALVTDDGASHLRPADARNFDKGLFPLLLTDPSRTKARNGRNISSHRERAQIVHEQGDSYWSFRRQVAEAPAHLDRQKGWRLVAWGKPLALGSPVAPQPNVEQPLVSVNPQESPLEGRALFLEHSPSRTSMLATPLTPRMAVCFWQRQLA